MKFVQNDEKTDQNSTYSKSDLFPDNTEQPLTTVSTISEAELATVTSTENSQLTTVGPSENATLANVTDILPISGRSAKSLSLRNRGREGRIINDSTGKKLNIQGFIPIVSLDQERNKQDEEDEEDDGPVGPYPPQPIPLRPAELVPPHSGPYPPQGPQVSYPGNSGSVSYPPTGSATYLGQYDNQPYRGLSQAISGFPIRSPKRDSSKPNFFPDDDTDAPVYQEKKPKYPPTPFYQEKPKYHPAYSSSEDEKPKYLPSLPGPVYEKPNYLPSPHTSLNEKPKYLPPYPGTLDKKPDYLPSLPSRGQKPKYLPAPVYQDQKPKQFGLPGQFDDAYQDAVYEQPGAGYVPQDVKEPCICVPFYLCKGGFLDSSAARNVNPPIDERSAPKAKSKSKRSTNTTVSS